MPWKLEIDEKYKLVKVTLDDKRHKTGWDFVILDSDGMQSITYATTDMEGFAAEIRDIHKKVCGADQFSEGAEVFAKSEGEAKQANYHIELHARMLEAFKIGQAKTDAAAFYLHDHWALGKPSIAKLVKLGVENGFLDQRLMKALYKEACPKLPGINADDFSAPD